jgi:hypothetical protein
MQSQPVILEFVHKLVDAQKSHSALSSAGVTASKGASNKHPNSNKDLTPIGIFYIIVVLKVDSKKS